MIRGGITVKNLNIAQTATINGKVRFGNDVYIAQGATVRSNGDAVIIGNNSWVLENSVVIGTDKNPTKVGSKSVFGHKCTVIGAQIGDLCEIGNGAIFMPGCMIGDKCIIGEGTLIPEGLNIPDGSVVLGRPARVIRKITEEDKNRITRLRGNDISLYPFEENILDEKRMECVDMSKLNKVNGNYPQVDESSFIYSSAEINGDVKIGKNTIIGPGVKIIGDSHGPVIIGDNVQILENSVLHLLPDNELIIEDNVIIGPSSIIHGTILGEGSIVESGVNISDYSVVGKNCIVKAGSLVKQRSRFEDNTIIEGFPAKEVGKLDKILERPKWVL